MVQMYTIAGRQIGSHYLAMAVLGTTFTAAYAAMSGPSKAKTGATPPINAGSSDEEKYIKDFLAKADEDKKQTN